MPYIFSPIKISKLTKSLQNNLRFANDILLVSENLKELEIMLYEHKETGTKAGLLIYGEEKNENTFSKIIKVGQNTEIITETNDIDEKTDKKLNRKIYVQDETDFGLKKKQAPYITQQYIKLWL